MPTNLDDLTLHKYRALTETPQGQHPGDIFEATEAAGDVLVTVGCAERVAADTHKSEKAKGYNRRDQKAKA